MIDLFRIFERHGFSYKFEVRPRWVGGWRLNRRRREWRRAYWTPRGIMFDRVSLDRV